MFYYFIMSALRILSMKYKPASLGEWCFMKPNVDAYILCNWSMSYWSY